MLTEWFLDTFPSVAGLSDTSPLSPSTRSSSDHSSRSVDQLFSECGSDEQLRNFCMQFCSFHKRPYPSGLAVVARPLAGILPADSLRLEPLLVALQQYFDRFCFPLRPPTQMAKLANYWKHGGRSPTQEAVGRHITALLRFHRPGPASVIEAASPGADAVPPCVWEWIGSGFVSACDGASTARELMMSIASTGEPAAVPLLAVAALDFIVTSSLSWEDFVISPTNLVELWSIASELSATTPSVFSRSFLAAVNSSRATSAVSATVLVDGLPILSILPEVVVQDLLHSSEDQPPQAADLDGDPANASVVYSMCEDSANDTAFLTLKCIAGTSIASALRVFHTTPQSPAKIGIVYIDCRSGAERDDDDCVVVGGGSAVGGSADVRSRKNTFDQDWLGSDVSVPGSTAGADVDGWTDVVDEKFVVHRLKTCLWVDSDLDFTRLVDSPTDVSPESVFVKNLEFYRGNRLCVIGSVQAQAFLTRLLSREFPYVCVLSGGFGALREALVASSDAMSAIRSLVIIGDEASAIAKRKERELAPSSSVSQKWVSHSKWGSNIIQSVQTSQLKSKWTTFASTHLRPLRSSPATPTVPASVVVSKASAPIVVVPDPVPSRRSTPSPSPPRVTTPPAFEIGEDAPDGDNSDVSGGGFSSIDLSPTSVKSEYT